MQTNCFGERDLSNFPPPWFSCSPEDTRFTWNCQLVARQCWWQITRCSTVKTIYHWWMVWHGIIPYIHPTFVPTWETYQDSNFDDVEVHHALRGMIGGLGLLASRIICYFSKCNVFIIIKPRQMNLLGQLFRKGPTFWGPKTRVLRMFQPCSRTTFMGLMNPHLLGGFLVGALLRRLLRRFGQAPPLWARAARNLSRSNRAWKSYESYDPAIQLGYVGPVRNCPGLCWNMFFSGGRTFVENWWTSWIFLFLFHIGNLIAVVGSSWCQQKRWILQVLPANSGIQATEMSIL